MPEKDKEFIDWIYGENTYFYLAYYYSIIMDVLKKLQEAIELKPEYFAAEYATLLDSLLKPSFGALSKKEMELMIFQSLQRSGVLDDNPEIFDLVKGLRITRAKARNLLYESNLREYNDESMRSDLKELLANAVYQKAGDQTLKLEVSNPMLIDYIKSILKENKQYSDGSFSPELITMSFEGYVTLIFSVIDPKEKDAFEKKLKNDGIIDDRSPKKIAARVLKGLLNKAIGEAGDILTEEAGEVFKTAIDSLPNLLKRNSEVYQSVLIEVQK